MFEYAISCGEGTLLDYGTARDSPNLEAWESAPKGATLIMADAPDDCETGE